MCIRSLLLFSSSAAERVCAEQKSRKSARNIRCERCFTGLRKSALVGVDCRAAVRCSLAAVLRQRVASIQRIRILLRGRLNDRLFVLTRIRGRVRLRVARLRSGRYSGRDIVRRDRAATSAAAAAAAATAACSAGGAGSATATGCAAYQAYQGHKGATVTISSSLTGTEAERFEASVAEFESCTGINVEHTGTTELRSQLLNGSGANLSTSSGASPSSQDNPENLPDLAIVPQPAMVAELVDTGVVHPLPNKVNSNVEAGWDRHWIQVGIHASVPYGAPLMVSLKSLVWYSPDAFAKAGYEVPGTWAELEALTSKIRSDHPDGSVTPWCVGAADGESTGWVLTDWLEDALLATQGPGVYETWASHRVPVDSSNAVEALGAVNSLVLDNGRVAGGRGSVISRTPVQAGAELVKGSCLMLHASSSFESRFPEGTAITDADGANPVTVQAPHPTASATARSGAAGATASANGATRRPRWRSRSTPARTPPAMPPQIPRPPCHVCGIRARSPLGPK